MKSKSTSNLSEMPLYDDAVDAMRYVSIYGKTGKIRGKVGIYLTGLVQVLLVALNTYQISHGHVVGAVLVGFLISLVWTFNVKSVAFGSNWDRLVYAGGACTGTLAGIGVSKLVYGN